MKKETKIKFEHLEFTKKEFKEQNLKILKIKDVLKSLRGIHQKMMKKHHYNYCPDAVWRDMQEKCIIFSNGIEVLITKERFNEMIKIYREDKNCDHMSFYHIKDFNPIRIMFIRNQISEC